MNEIIDILRERDGITYDEAMNLVENCRNELHELIESGATLIECEDCIADWLGLEPDYFMDLMG